MSLNLKEILLNGESQTQEFKASFSKEVTQTLTAFANTHGGTVYKDGLIEKYGSGIKRVLKAFAAYELTPPVFEEFQHGLKVTVFSTPHKPPKRKQLDLRFWSC